MSKSKQRKDKSEDSFDRLDAAFDRFERNLLIDMTIVMASLMTVAVVVIKW